MKDIKIIEQKRQEIQKSLDRSRTQEERNIMGQFPTPISLATDIVKLSKSLLLKNKKIKFLDPAIGTGSFFSALSIVVNQSKIEKALGFEVDKHYGLPSSKLWSNSILSYQIQDFTKESPPVNEDEKFNLVICNPPYVRHHHINGEKQRLRDRTLMASGIQLSGLAGLYCYFIGLAQSWMESNAIGAWLIPGEFMDVKYGAAVKDYLLRRVTLIQVHQFNPLDIQFEDALVSSAVIFIKNSKPKSNHKVKFTYGKDLNCPDIIKLIELTTLKSETKWSRFPKSDKRRINTALRLSDFFTIKRGIATGDNNFFILTHDEIKKYKLPLSMFRPILPSPRNLHVEIIESDDKGFPILLNQLFVLNTSLSVVQIRSRYPKLYDYLQEGIEKGVADRYLCKNRKIWYSQENRDDSLFYCTYIGRSDNLNGRPFRFVLNLSKAIVTNSYLILYPKANLLKRLNEDTDLKFSLISKLNTIPLQSMLDEGRSYGGGLHKLEPKELSNVPAIAFEKLMDI